MDHHRSIIHDSFMTTVAAVSPVMLLSGKQVT